MYSEIKFCILFFILKVVCIDDQSEILPAAVGYKGLNDNCSFSALFDCFKGFCSLVLLENICNLNFF